MFIFRQELIMFLWSSKPRSSFITKTKGLVNIRDFRQGRQRIPSGRGQIRGTKASTMEDWSTKLLLVQLLKGAIHLYCGTFSTPGVFIQDVEITQTGPRRAAPK